MLNAPLVSVGGAVSARDCVRFGLFARRWCVVHCADLKPENLLLSTKNRLDGTINMIDFGCATIFTEEEEEEQELLDHDGRSSSSRDGGGKTESGRQKEGAAR